MRPHSVGLQLASEPQADKDSDRHIDTETKTERETHRHTDTHRHRACRSTPHTSPITPRIVQVIHATSPSLDKRFVRSGAVTFGAPPLNKPLCFAAHLSAIRYRALLFFLFGAGAGAELANPVQPRFAHEPVVVRAPSTREYALHSHARVYTLCVSTLVDSHSTMRQVCDVLYGL